MPDIRSLAVRREKPGVVEENPGWTGYYLKQIIHSLEATKFILKWEVSIFYHHQKGVDSFVKFNYRKIESYFIYLFCPSS